MNHSILEESVIEAILDLDNRLQNLEPEYVKYQRHRSSALTSFSVLHRHLEHIKKVK